MRHTLLIIDDDTLILNTLREFFSRIPGEIFTARTFDEAKKILTRFTPDLVLTDLLLQDNAGAGDILDYIKTKPGLIHMPVLIFTNLDTPELRNQMREKGAKEYMVKGNFSLDDLYSKVMQYLEPVK